ncbi:MAG: OmpP1/FadL family transporter [Thermoguttaceae bacterium]
MGKQGLTLSHVFLASLLSLLALPGTLRGQGIALSGAGPVNRAMAGASTAAPIDAAGALMWNPGSINGLQGSEADFGLELLLPTEKLFSNFSAYGLQGSTGGEPGVTAIPEMAFAHKSEDSPWAYGLGIFAIGGFSTNYPASLTNPVLTPQPPNGVGLGRVSSLGEYYQVVPTVSFALTEKLSVGFAPTLTLARLDVNPMVFIAPDKSAGTGYTYPTADGTRYHFGGGFQLGVYYTANEAWHFGVCFKSPQWFERFTSNTVDELGRPEVASVRFDYPLILSLGTSYTGIENWLFACDVRYFNYSGTDGFGSPAAFAPNGEVTGLGWKDTVSVHTGAQYYAMQNLALRMGYQYNSSPVGSDEAFFNVASPLVIEHVLGVGFSYRMTCNEILSVAYLHGFQNQVSGPIQAPGFGAIPGTSVTSAISADALSAGITIQY